MKTFVLLSLLLSLGFSDFKPSTQVSVLNKNPSPFKQALERLIEGWQDPSQRQDYEAMGTWVPEIGIRGKYAANQHLLSVLALGSLIGEPLFVQGPHLQGPSFNSNSFGYYNPKFLKKLEKELKTIFADKAFVQKAQPVYNKHLKSYVRHIKMADIHLSNKNTMSQAITAYRQAITGTEASMTMQEHFRYFSDAMQVEGMDWYEINTAALFWVRREMDGTRPMFQKLLNLVIKHFDPK